MPQPEPLVGPVPPPGATTVGPVPPPGATTVGPVPPPGATIVGPVPSPGAVVPPPGAIPIPKRLRRLHRIWPDRTGNISYLLTLCVDGRGHFDNQSTFEKLVSFLPDSPQRYQWYGRRFVVMPDHLHLIVHMGHTTVRLGQWVKALKAVVGGLQVASAVGRVPSRGASSLGAAPCNDEPPLPHHPFTRIERSWRWQAGFHDHKFRTPESEARKWEYICLNPVRAGLAARPEDWPFGGEIFYDEPSGPRLVRGTPPLLDQGILILEPQTPGEGTGPTPPPL